MEDLMYGISTSLTMTATVMKAAIIITKEEMTKTGMKMMKNLSSLSVRPEK